MGVKLETALRTLGDNLRDHREHTLDASREKASERWRISPRHLAAIELGQTAAPIKTWVKLWADMGVLTTVIQVMESHVNDTCFGALANRLDEDHTDDEKREAKQTTLHRS